MQAAATKPIEKNVSRFPASKLSPLERKRMLQDWVFISPQLILFLVLTLVPLIISLPILFTDMSDFNDPNPQPVGFANFTAILTDSSIQRDYFPALERTVVFVMLNYSTVFVFGLGLALLMFEVGFRGGFFTVVYLPLMVSGFGVGSMAVMLFSRDTGTANLLFREIGLLNEPIDIFSREGATVIMPLLVGWRYAGYNMAIFLSGLLSIPQETIESSIVDGTTYWQRLWNVYFPQMMPSFILATTMCLIGSFAVFDELVALGALYVNPEAKLLSILFFTYGFQVERLALGMTLALETFLPLMAIGIFLQRLQRRLQY